MKTYYLHTIDGKAATFDGYQICYASFYGKPNQLATSLAQIRKEQLISKAYREEAGIEDVGIISYLRYSL